MKQAAEPGGPGPAHGVKTLAVDDHCAFRETIRDLIAATPGFTLVGLVGSGEEAVVAVEKLSPHLVLMDVLMPGMDGIAAARIIMRRDPRVFVVLISADDPLLYAAAAELGGTVGCARKQDLGPNRLRQVWESHIE